MVPSLGPWPPRCTRTSPPPTTPGRTAPRPTSSAGSAGTRVGPRGGQAQVTLDVLEAVTVRTTPPAPETLTGISTCKSTPECSPPGNGADCTPSASATSSPPLTELGTPRSP